MTYNALLKVLNKMTPEELRQKVVLYEADSGGYSNIIGCGKTKVENENLGCPQLDNPSGWKRGQRYLVGQT